MRLRVLNIAYSLAPVGPAAVGGAEEILGILDQALVTAGHTSLVVACPGSSAAGRLFAPDGEGMDRFQAAIDRAVALHRIDVVHMHGFDFWQYTTPAHIPLLVTLHLPAAWYPQEIWSRYQGRAHFVCVSQSQRRTMPAEVSDVHIVENGIVLPETVTESPRDDCALALGRICPEKNVHEALEAADRAGVGVTIGGRVYPYPDHQRYFEEKVRPLLDAPGSKHRFAGALSPREKNELLARARCLLHPTLAPETSSLVAMEAMAAGCPVIGYRSGALPEIVEDGVTGFLVNDVPEMAAAIEQTGSIAPQACRQRARLRFAAGRMTSEYFAIYHELATERRMRFYA